MLIPVEMCFYAISNKFIRPFQLYIYLKSICSGKIIIQQADFKKIAEALNLKSERTIKNNLKILLKNNWIGHNKKSGYYFIRGFEKIRTYFDFKSRTGAEFETKDITKFKAFIAGAVIGYLVSQQKRREWVSERKKWRSNQLTHKPSKLYPIANFALAKILNASYCKAQGLKKLAHKAGYILLKKNFTDTGVDAKFKRRYKKVNPENAHRVRLHKNKLVLQDTDTALSDIRFKRRKKIDTYKSGL